MSKEGKYARNYGDYRFHGMLPLPAAGKRPIVKWEEELDSYTPETYKTWAKEHPDANIWTYLGEDFVGLDPDGEGAERFVQALDLPDCPMSKSGGKSVHRWFKGSPGIQPLKVKMDDGSILEVRTGRQGMLVPPSIHPETNRPYEWVEGKDLFAVDLPELPAKAYHKILAAANGPEHEEVVSQEWRKELIKGVPEGERNNALAKLAGVRIANGWTLEDVLDWAQGLNRKNRPPMNEEEVDRTVRSVYKTHNSNHPFDLPSVGFEEGEDGEQIDIAAQRTDVGNAKRFIKAHGENVRFCYLWNRWLVWDGKRWEVDDSGKIAQMATDTVIDIYDEVKNAPEAERTEVFRHAQRSQYRDRINAMLDLAKSSVSIKPDQLDQNPMLLNVLNGTINLATGELRPHSREDHITKLAPVNYDPDAEAPNWMKHLELIFNGNQSLISFLQIAVGYSLTGRTDADVMFISWGSGANGKSFSHELIGKILGDYSMRTPTETLLLKQYGGGIPNDVARLKGSRFVYASEADEGKRLNESLIKDLTGGDTISARFMRAEWFQFRPECKIWLATNHKPQINGTDYGIWRRIRLIPFDVTIPEKERKPRVELERTMMKEAAGILAWAVEGCKRLIEDEFRLPFPEEVKKATDEYKQEMDLIGDFLADRCVLDPQATVSNADLFRAYTEWCESTGEKPLKQRAFSNRVEERGCGRKKGTGGVRLWTGIGLVAINRSNGDPSRGKK